MKWLQNLLLNLLAFFGGRLTELERQRRAQQAAENTVEQKRADAEALDAEQVKKELDGWREP